MKCLSVDTELSVQKAILSQPRLQYKLLISDWMFWFFKKMKHTFCALLPSKKSSQHISWNTQSFLFCNSWPDDCFCTLICNKINLSPPPSFFCIFLWLSYSWVLFSSFSIKEVNRRARTVNWFCLYNKLGRWKSKHEE